MIELLILLSRHWIAFNCYCMMFCSMLSAYYFVCDVIPLPYHYRLNTFYAAIEIVVAVIIEFCSFCCNVCLVLIDFDVSCKVLQYIGRETSYLQK